MSDIRHVTKRTHIDSKSLVNHQTWCGSDITSMEWHFQDAQHVLLYLDNGAGSITPCRECLEAMKRVIDKELGT